jgi:hypothetical protein
MTGSELYALIQQNIDVSYTGNLDPAKCNRWLNTTSYVKVVQDIYNDKLNNQNAYDELSYLIAVNKIFSVNNNKIFHKPIPVTNITFLAGTATVITELPHNLISGDNVEIQNTQGTITPALNGATGSATIIDSTTFTFGFTRTGGTYTPNTGQVTGDKIIGDYYHYLWSKAKFNTPVYNVTVTSASNTTPIKITLNKRTKLRSKDLVTQSGAIGNTAVNGARYLKQLNEYAYSLYTDVNLQNPVSGNGVYLGGARISVSDYQTCKFKRSDEKGGIYGQPSAINPYFEQGELMIYLEPLDIMCDEITINYIRTAPIVIDVNDTVIDYERYFPLYFLTKLASDVGRNFAIATRDGNLIMSQTEQEVDNP